MRQTRKNVKREKVPAILSKKLEHALKGYVPEMGNLDDINIVKSLGKLKKKLETIDSRVFRDIERSKDLKKLTSKMKEIQREEGQLIYQITRRNLDF
jgi:hypothetical protein